MCRAILDGAICGSHDYPEVHHLVPMAVGGEPFDGRNLVTVCNDHHHLVEHGLLEISPGFDPREWGDEGENWGAYESAKRRVAY